MSGGWKRRTSLGVFGGGKRPIPQGHPTWQNDTSLFSDWHPTDFVPIGTQVEASTFELSDHA